MWKTAFKKFEGDIVCQMYLLIGRNFNAQFYFEEHHWISISEFVLWWIEVRSSPPEVFLCKGVLKICSKFAGKPPCWCVISIKLQNNFIEITLRDECSSINLLHIFRKPFYENTYGGLLLGGFPHWFCS